MKKLLFVILLSSVVHAQNPVAGPKSFFEWEQAADDLEIVQGYTFRYYLDAGQASTFINVTCTGTASPFTCRVLVPTMTQGTHSITLTATSAAGESPASLPFAFAFVANPPTAPTSIRITP
jgi:hypothetical protein